MKKIILIIVMAIIIVLIPIIISAVRHPNINMKFDQMRIPTQEESINNACNRATMAADEDYVCFYDEKYGLVSYNIKKNQYTVLATTLGTSWLFCTPNTEVYYNNLQIQDSCLYYAKNNMRNRVQTGIWKVDLKSGKKEQIKTDSYDDNGYFAVINHTVLLQTYSNQLVKIEANIETEIADDIKGYTILENNLYYGKGNTIIKQSLIDANRKEVIYEDSSFSQKVEKYFVYGNKVYFAVQAKVGAIDYELYEIENDKATKIDSVIFNSEPNLVFYNGYLVSNTKVYSSDFKEVAKFNYPASFKPVIVGGNLYAYCEEALNLPMVGKNWYKLDIQNFI